MSYIIVLDCETSPLDNTLASITPSNMACYDLGWEVLDRKTWETVKERSYINSDIFFDEPMLMKSAYYADKIPQYMENIKSGKSKVGNLYEIRMKFLHDLRKYKVKEVYAHNARFDVGALNNTQRWETSSKYRYFFPYDVTICDSLKMARSVIGTMPSYKKFCLDNGYMTKHSTPRCRLTAEVLYRFITKDLSFEEEHKGLDDVRIEAEIIKYCYKQHKKMNKVLYAKNAGF